MRASSNRTYRSIFVEMRALRHSGHHVYTNDYMYGSTVLQSSAYGRHILAQFAEPITAELYIGMFSKQCVHLKRQLICFCWLAFAFDMLHYYEK